MGKDEEKEGYGNQGDGTFGEIKDTSLSIKTPEGTPELLRLNLNPRVTFPALILIWSFIIWCMVDNDAQDRTSEASNFITEKLTWLYIGSQDFWAVFMIVLYFSKYGKLKLGKDDEEPEYPTATWFTMLFACGIGVGLFYYGVAEPIFHYTGANRYSADPYMTDNSLAQNAINLTFYHWGIHGWITYSCIGCLLGIIVYRHGLPMKMSSCFYPLLGDKIFGWLGDAIDILSIITTLFGVCTSLGLGVIQLNAGLHILNADIPKETYVRNIIIWSITAIATVSCLSGMDVGIRRLSEICFGLGMFLLTLFSLLSDPVYLLNLFVQSIGYYINWVIQLGFHCDAFEMEGSGGMPSERNRISTAETSGPELWMDGWTIFYWGWWIAWSPFVGIFIAKISRGRTVREFINGTMTAPILYTFFWMTVFGGAGLSMERTSASLGYCCPSDFKEATALPAGPGYIEAAHFDSYCKNYSCGECSLSILESAVTKGLTLDNASLLVSQDQNSFARSDDKDYVRLSCFGVDEMWFFLMETNGGLGKFLEIISLVSIILYFVTSSDSGSYIIDSLGSNGDLDPPKLQRFFWAITEGAAATALLTSGGAEALSALQTVAIVAGLPYTIILCFVCVALWRCCQVSYRDIDFKAPNFKIGYTDFLTEFKLSIILEWFLAFVAGPYWACKAGVRAWQMSDISTYVLSAIAYCLFFMFLLFHFLHLAVDEMWALAWTSYFAFATLIGVMKTAVRQHEDFIGNPVEDFFAALFCYPSVCQQVRYFGNGDVDYVVNKKVEPVGKHLEEKL